MCIRDSPSIPRRTGSLRGRNLFGRGQQKSARASPFSVETTRNYTSIGLAGARFFSAVALLVKRRGVVAEPSGGDRRRRAQRLHRGVSRAAQQRKRSGLRLAQCWYNFASFQPKMEMPVLISAAHAQTGSGLGGFLSGEGLMGLLPIILMFALLYFLMIRPQMKRAKELKAMTDALQKGDEVITAAGLVGRITKVGDVYISLEIAPGTEIQMQKAAVQTLLPKGAIKAMS